MGWRYILFFFSSFFFFQKSVKKRIFFFFKPFFSFPPFFKFPPSLGNWKEITHTRTHTQMVAEKRGSSTERKRECLSFATCLTRWPCLDWLGWLREAAKTSCPRDLVPPVQKSPPPSRDKRRSGWTRPLALFPFNNQDFFWGGFYLSK